MRQYTLSVDMHGGDGGFTSMAEALVGTLQTLPEDVSFVLCGLEDLLFQALSNPVFASAYESGRILFHPSNPLELSGRVSRVSRDEPNSSLVQSLILQRDGVVCGTLSAGDTGALYTSSLLMLGVQEGISRPALAAVFPSSGGGSVLILDVGANLECRPEHLHSFARLGRDFMRGLLKREPKVSLLNVGLEEHKGTPVVQEAHRLFREDSSLSYGGFIEGNRVLTGDADITVCDGFTGNALLKVSEGLYRFVRSHLGDTLSVEGRRRLEIFDSELQGAVPILGIKGRVFKAHGGSSSWALQNALVTAAKTIHILKEIVD